ncbi:MAG: type I-E CRISPR-associated protein Cas6/Cse3/CasE [Acidobacteriota bacterium]
MPELSSQELYRSDRAVPPAVAPVSSTASSVRELPRSTTAIVSGAALGAPHHLRLILDAGEVESSFGRRFAGHGTVDLGYRIHCRLRALFGDQAPSAFHVERQGDHLVVSAWSPLDARILRCCAEAHGERALVDAPWRVASRPGVEAWPGDHTFTLRACPVMRRSRDGVELDVLEHARRTAQADGVQGDSDWTRVYGDWLRARLAQAGLAVADVRVLRRRLVDLHRRARRDRRGRRRGRWLRRPDVVFHGRLVSPDPSILTVLLVRGFGRHRAFGFGMLRPALAELGEQS